MLSHERRDGPNDGRRKRSGDLPGLQNQWLGDPERWVRFPSASAKSISCAEFTKLAPLEHIMSNCQST